MTMTRFTAALGAAAFVLALAACGSSDSSSPGPATGTTIKALSNRADLVSGGSALIQVSLPVGTTIAKLKVDRDGTDVTSAFITRADGRTVGLVSGLKNGANNINATSTDGSFTGARLVVTNHPIGGPLLQSSQVTPFVCATPVPVAESGNTPGSNASGLSTVATDAQCNIATEFKFFYRTKTAVTVTAGDGGCSFVTYPDPTPTVANPNPTTPANSCFQPYVAGTTAASAVANTTTTNGVTVPYIVRVERGTVNRGIYDIAVLFDPTKTWTPNAPQPQWNGKIVYTFGASTGQPRRQYRSEQSWADDAALSRGFITVDNSMNDSLYNSSRVVNVETVIMMKEKVTNSYGEIVYTVGNGCSGGSINQNTAASIYPGLLDGIQVQCDFPDSITTGIEVSDCVLLVNFYSSPAWAALTAGLTTAQINAKKTAINGHLDQVGCQSWNNSFGFNNKPGNYIPTLVSATGVVAPSGAPRNNCQLPAALVYDPVTNPTGPRCGDPDLAVAVWGLAAGTTRANASTDNVGVQYGFKALLAGAITAEEFVTLNERIGGTDADSNLTASRSVADLPALDIAYRAGILSSGAQLAKLPIIDLRGYDEQGIHYNWRSYEERDRLDAQGGGHGNQVIWRYGSALVAPAASGLPVLALTTIDTWLTTLNTIAPKSFLNGERTAAQVLAAKPATAFDFCYLTSDTTYSNKVTDQTVCDGDARLAVHTSPRQVAGGPRTENILKCQLKALNLADYTGITLTAAQQGRLQATFAAGVCDWTKPGVSQQAAVSPLTFAAGPGGVAMPPAPTSSAL